jgi:hypothetical protein
MLRVFPILALLALASVAQADLIYYSVPGSHGIRSVTGAVVHEDSGSLTVRTADGKQVTIPRADVYQVVRQADGLGDAPQDPEATGTAATETPSSDLGDLAPGSADMLSGMTQMSRVLGRNNSRSAPAPRTYHLGALGGMTMANLPTDPGPLEESDSLRSFTVGGWWRKPIRNRLALQAEAIYAVKGDSETSGGYTTSTRISYLDLPVLARYGFRKNSPLQPILFAGPAVAINLTAQSRLEGEGTDVEVDVKDQVNTLDFGLVAGAGLDFVVGGRTYGVEMRYSKGLSNVAGDDANGSAHNNVLGILGSVTLQ